MTIIISHVAHIAQLSAIEKKNTSDTLCYFYKKCADVRVERYLEHSARKYTHEN